MTNIKRFIHEMIENLNENFGDLSGIALSAIIVELIFLFTIFTATLIQFINQV